MAHFQISVSTSCLCMLLTNPLKAHLNTCWPSQSPTNNALKRMPLGAQGVAWPTLLVQQVALCCPLHNTHRRAPWQGWQLITSAGLSASTTYNHEKDKQAWIIFRRSIKKKFLTATGIFWIRPQGLMIFRAKYELRDNCCQLVLVRHLWAVPPVNFILRKQTSPEEGNKKRKMISFPCNLP